jgi:hypothetical protein
VARHTAASRRTHKAANAIERRLAKAIALAMERIRERVSIYALMPALERRKADDVAALIPDSLIDDALRPVATIMRDAMLKGRALGKVSVREAIK